ncbi:glycosyltransferase family 61 protein [Marinicauda salina]|nr:glycosyltransferase 61 family protein [Marinicauda salina]
MRVQIKSLDAAVKGRTEPESRLASASETLRLAVSGRVEAGPRPDLFLEINDETRKAREALHGKVEAARGFPIGRLRLENVYVAGHEGAILDPVNEACWTGMTAGWPEEAALKRLKEFDFARQAGVSHFVLDDFRTLADKGLSLDRVERAAVLTGPGGRIYGHWLIDVLPRLDHYLEDTLEPGTLYLTNPLKPFMREILTAVGADWLALRDYHPSRIHAVDELIIETLPRHFHVVQASRLHAGLERLEHGLPAVADTGIEPARKIYVSRARWQRRTLVNGVEIEAYLAGRGWRVVHPETLTVAEQRALFSCAEIVLGEDGSGLHNTLFSPPGARLLVINLGRSNLFHASLSDIKEQHIAYIDAEPNGAKGWHLPIDRLADTLAEVDR